MEMLLLTIKSGGATINFAWVSQLNRVDAPLGRVIPWVFPHLTVRRCRT